MLNIVIPMAGRGQRFADAGFAVPKPWIPIHGVPMIELVVRNLRPRRPHRFFFAVLERHLADPAVAARLYAIAPGCEILPVPDVTEGAACTVLLAKPGIDTDAPLVIANSDQWIDFAIEATLARFDPSTAAGWILTMPADHPKWSYLRLDPRGRVTEVVEKQVVSREATVGIYGFRHGADFVDAAERMIARGARVNGEFYVAPTYNELLADGAEIFYENIGDRMHGLGVPEDLRAFLQNPISLRAAEF